MTESARLDAFRRGLLADMGIDVWVLRENAYGALEEAPADAIVVPEPAPPREKSAPDRKREIAEQVEVAPPPAQPKEKADTRPAVQEPATAGAEAAADMVVTCLSRPGALLLAHGREWAQAGRLGRDLLAAATGNWGEDPRRISFDWQEPGAPTDGWRAFKAFADKQLADAEASVLFVSETLVDHLPERARAWTLIVLPALKGFDADAKRAIWTRIRTLQP